MTTSHDEPTPADDPDDQTRRIMWRQWALHEAMMMRPNSGKELIRLADRIFAWVTEPYPQIDQ